MHAVAEGGKKLFSDPRWKTEFESYTAHVSHSSLPALRARLSQDRYLTSWMNGACGEMEDLSKGWSTISAFAKYFSSFISTSIFFSLAGLFPASHRRRWGRPPGRPGTAAAAADAKENHILIRSIQVGRGKIHRKHHLLSREGRETVLYHLAVYVLYHSRMPYLVHFWNWGQTWGGGYGQPKK